MHTLTHTRMCAAIGDIVNQVAELISLAKSERECAVWYVLNDAAKELCSAQSKACHRCHWEAS